MTIVNATPADEQAIRALLVQTKLPHEDIAPHLSNFITARDEAGNLLGAVGLELCGEAGLLRSLAASEAARGKGLGGELALRAEEAARKAGLNALYLLTTTAEAFFARRGYAAVSRDEAPDAVRQTLEFKSICPASATCMVKFL